MSKHCEVCNRSYPDSLTACPHCAEAVEVDEADVVEMVKEAPEITEDVEPTLVAGDHPDSAVDLGLPPLADVNASGSNQGEGSGVSVIEWASLVEEGPAPPEPAAASFDDPADAHLIDEAGAQAKGGEAPPADEDALAADLDAVRTIFGGDASASFVRRGPAPARPPDDDESAVDLTAGGEAKSAPAPQTGSESEINLGPTRVPAMPGGSGSEIDLGPGMHAAPATGSGSEIDLGPAPPVAHEPEVIEGSGSGIDVTGAELEAEVVEEAAVEPAPASGSGIDLAAAEGPTAHLPHAGARPVSDSGIDLSGEEVALGATDSGPQAHIEKGAPDASDSGIDRIAEEVESGMLPAPATFEAAGDSKAGLSGDKVDELVVGESGTALAAGQLASGEEEVDLTEKPTEMVESSAVDLGGASDLGAAREAPSGDDDREKTRPYEVQSRNIHGVDGVSPSEVDLGARHRKKAAESGADFFEESSAMAMAPAASGTAEEEGLDADDDEEATAAVEEEPAGAEEEAVAAAPAPAMKEKRRSTAGAWVGGVLIGGAVTVGVLVGLWLFGVEPPKEWRLVTPPPVAHGAPPPIVPVSQGAGGDKELNDKIAKATAESESLKKDLETSKKETETARGEVDAARKDLDAARKDLATAKNGADAGAKDLNDKLAKATADANAFKTQLDAAKKETGAAQKEAEAAKKDLDASKKDVAAAKEEAESRKKELADEQTKAAKLTADLKVAKDEAAKKDDTLKGVAAALASAKFIKPDAGDAAVLSAVKDMVQSADAKEARQLIASLRNEATALKDQAAGLAEALKQRWTPERMLTYWMPLLREGGAKDLAADAIADADRVLKADKASVPAKARAHAVKGLALRVEGKYAEAKAELEQAKAAWPKDDDKWLKDTEAALKEASDPSTYFAAQAQALRKEGRTEQALDTLNRALETAAPEAKARLLVERGALRLDEALTRGKGRLSADDELITAAQKDAEEAKKNDAAESSYLSGRIAEALGRFDGAADAYRQALAAHGGLDADGVRYRAALARVLVMPRSGKPLSWNGPAGLEVLAALIAVGLQPGDVGQSDAAAREALRLADEILSAKEGDVPFEARAQAYAIKGMWTQALTTYVDGLRPSLSPEHASGLMAIIQGHPALRRPTSMTAADPLDAAKHYAAGLNWYADRDYALAEKEFFAAVERDGQDARYHYYLGLSRLMQGDSAANEDFEQGARLEQRSRPPRAAVSAALERVQGEARDRLNEIRDRPR